MGSGTVRVGVSAASIFGLLAAALVFGAGAANARPENCQIDRSLMGASAVCHSGTGLHAVEIDCFGVFVKPAGLFPELGRYTASGYPYTPIGQKSEAGCRDGSALNFGIVTDARIRETFPGS
ncbi:hypothetical protein [Nocardia wallacei]|uniref:Secreted protein n=1 Tax=Nocardia wallacei TaxID=480035 RepID=A0A7G1KV07_9NOCA|nr:hypothetical protein [Nocardia wallacei]BCK59118.1 hypothetical protein NWFMUON74_68900 [Nocardia wallacei]